MTRIDDIVNGCWRFCYVLLRHKTKCSSLLKPQFFRSKRICYICTKTLKLMHFIRSVSTK